MAGAEILVFLLVAVALLAGLGLRYDVPYPIVLVLGGLALGFVPGLPAPDLSPDLILFFFLPPLLYAAAFEASAYELRANALPISLLAVGLVLATMVAVAAVAHWVVGVPWTMAFVLGAVLGPTDPVAATAVLRRVGGPSRIQTILEGESLVNDGTGLTALGVAVSALGAASLTVGGVALDFVVTAAGGIAIGLVVGWVIGRLRESTREPSIDVVLSVLTPFAAYVPAEQIHVSGVLAVVTAGVFIGTRSLELSHAGARLRTLAFWQSLEFLLQGLLFLLVGLQLTNLVEGIEDARLVALASDAVVIALVVIGVRLVWMMVVPAVSHLRIVSREPTPPRERLVLGWSGMRGAVSLAAALAIPADAPARDLVIFLAYVVVVITLVVPGLTLGPMLSRLGLARDEDRRREEVEARLRLTRAALERLDGMTDDRSDVVERLRDRYRGRVERLEDRLNAAGGHPQHNVDAAAAQLEALEAERKVLGGLQRERAFPAELLRELEAELDVDEARVRSRGR